MQKKFILSITFLISIFVILLCFNLDSVLANQIRQPYKISYSDLSPTAKHQVECLAQNIYFESGHEPKEGQIAVAFVTINRMESGQFPNSICGVVKQKVQTTCQFSWYCDGKFDVKSLTHFNFILYNSVRELATYVYANHEKMEDPSRGALYYHADYVNPHWKNMVYLTKIGRHKFYNKKDES